MAGTRGSKDKGRLHHRNISTMRVGLLTVLALLGLAGAAPAGRGMRGGRKCDCIEKAGHNSGTKIIYDSGSSGSDSGSSWSGSGSSGSSGLGRPGGSGTWVKSSQHSGVYVKTVVYVTLVPAVVPVTTTCTEIGTIVLENDITINVTIAPTVPSLCKLILF